MHFNNKVALVTGAGSGIGSAVAHLLADLGATVAVIDSDTLSVFNTAKDINANGNRALAYTADVTDSVQIKNVINKIESEVGPIESLAHVAGVMKTSNLLETNVEDLEYLLKVNAIGTFIIVKEVGCRMMLRKSGAIAVVSSNAAFTPRIGIGAYASSKAAATMITKCLGLELSAKGIRCNIVSPGSTQTEMLSKTLTESVTMDSILAGSLEKYRLGIPLQRAANPIDVAHAIAFLLSDSANHITLSDLAVDGGATLGMH